MGQARDVFPIGSPDDLPNHQVKLVLLRAPDDENHAHPSFQDEIVAFRDALRGAGVDADARWITQDAVGGWCGYIGTILAAAAVIKAARPMIVAYMKRRPGRKVHVECDGLKIKIEEPSDEEVTRVLNLVEQRSLARPKKK